MFSASERVLYGKRQLIEVICQLRFPTILSISAKEPAEFQEAIRAEFPRYARNLEKLPPKVIGQPGAMKLEEQPTVVNYQFLTAAGDWKVNLTNTFLALATPVYTTWEDFARKLDEVLAQFVAIYHPAYFERIGLRYINGFSRRALGLEGVPFRDLIQPAYLGLMAEDDVQEQSGHGVRAKIDEHVVLVGNDKLMRECGVGCHECELTGTILHVSLDGEYIGHIVIADVVKPDAAEAVATLRAAGVKKTVMLTGDRADVAAGLLAPWRYMVRWQGYSEDEAREECGLADASSALPVEA